MNGHLSTKYYSFLYLLSVFWPQLYIHIFVLCINYFLFKSILKLAITLRNGGGRRRCICVSKYSVFYSDSNLICTSSYSDQKRYVHESNWKSKELISGVPTITIKQA